MSTRSSARNLFPPLDNPKLTIRRRCHGDPTLLNDFKKATDENGDPPVLDLRTMKELCQPSFNGRVNRVIDDALHLYLFPHSFTHHATAWFDRLPMNSINTFEQMAKMFLGKYFPPSMVTKLRNEITNLCQRPDESLFAAWERYKLSIDRCPNHNMLPITQIDNFYNGLTLRHHDTINAAAGGTFMKRRPEECYDLIENMTAHHNDWDTSAQRSESSSSITSSSDPEIIALKAKMAEKKNPMKVLQINQQVKAVTPSCETYGGPHSYNDCPATVGQTQNEDLKGITTQSGNAYQGPTIPTTSSSLPQVVERETEVTKDTVPPTNNGSTKDVQPLVFQIETPIPNFEPIVAPVIEPVVAPVSAPKPNQKPSIPYPPGRSWHKHKSHAIISVDKLSLPELSPTCMTLKLANRSISHPVGVAEDVFVKNKKALIDVYEGELTLRAGKEAITFNIDQTSRYSANYNDMTANQIDVIDMASVQHQRRVNLKIHGVIKKEDLKLLDAELIYPISDSPWVSPVYCVPKKGGFTVVENKENELILTRLVMGWCVCIDYRKLNDATCKDHFPLPFIDQMLKRLAGNEYYYFLDGFSGYFQIPIDPKDQERPHSRVLTKHLPNEKSHFMVKEGIVLGHKISKNGIEVEAKVLPTNDARVVCKFLKFLFARFGTPRAIISDRGTYFCNDQFAKVMLKYGVTHRLATAYHPQTSGKVQLNELNELRDQVYENSLIYKEKTKRLHDSKIKDCIFNVGDRVLHFNSRLKIFSGKLKTRWSGPFTINQVFPYGTLELSHTDGTNFKEFLDFEDLCSGFCPSITGSSLPQLHL
nr:reverse transcriptase domain-containing protein [Tanacetum cinerariifolium]